MDPTPAQRVPTYSNPLSLITSNNRSVLMIKFKNVCRGLIILSAECNSDIPYLSLPLGIGCYRETAMARRRSLFKYGNHDDCMFPEHGEKSSEAALFFEIRPLRSRSEVHNLEFIKGCARVLPTNPPWTHPAGYWERRATEPSSSHFGWRTKCRTSTEKQNFA